METLELLKQLERILQCQLNRQTTIKRKLYQADTFLQWLCEAEKDICSITPSDIYRYLESKPFCRAVQVQNLQVIRTIFDIFIEKELIFENPASQVRIKHEPITRSYDLPTFEEIKAITEKIMKIESHLALRDFLMVELAYGSSARVGELIALNIEDIRLDDKMILLKGKGRGAAKERTVPITDIAIRYIREYCRDRISGPLFLSYRGKRMTASAIYQRFKYWSGRNPHIFRHCFATHLLSNGCPTDLISKMLGHERSSSTTVYTHICDSDLQNRINNSHPRKISFIADKN
ncbi:MAG: tyrosine-type recombinase/integrase [Fibrobacter sp.]|nr:tyrosine-type recombinase/integrase [Fibrobacter sp.]